MNKAIEVGSFLFWVDDISFVQSFNDANGYFVRIALKDGAELRVDTHSQNRADELKSDIYDAMVEAQNTKDGDTK